MIDVQSREPALWKSSLLYLIVFILMYAYSFLCLGLDLDELMDFYGASLDTYTAQDRWGHTAYRLIFGMGTSIWAAGVSSGMYLALCFALQLRLMGLRSVMEQFLFGALSLACTQFGMLLGFMQHVDAIAFGLLLATISVTLLYQTRWNRYAALMLAVVLTAVALACYQTILFYAVVLILGVEVNRMLRRPASLLDWGLLMRSALMLCSAVLLWYVLRLLTHPLASEQAREYAANYHGSRSQLGHFFTLDIKMKCLYLAHYTKEMLLTALGSMSEGRWMYTTALLPLGYLLVRSLICLRGLARLCVPAALLSIWVLPFALIVVLGTEQPARTFLAEPLSLALLWSIAWGQAPSITMRPVVQRVAMLALTVLLVSAPYRTSAAERHRVHGYQLISAELQQMEQQRLTLSHAEQRDLRVMLVSMDDGGFDSLILMGPYVHHFNLSFFATPQSDEQKEQLSEKLKARPYWPAVGSVMREGDTLLIKYRTPWRRPTPSKLAL